MFDQENPLTNSLFIADVIFPLKEHHTKQIRSTYIITNIDTYTNTQSKKAASRIGQSITDVTMLAVCINRQSTLVISPQTSFFP